MVYQNKLVAAIKVNGRVLRESDGTVLLPFGSEYAVYLKNLNSRRVKVKVSVDQTDATDGTWLVIGPNSAITLERFIAHGNMQQGNRFKFIERTADVEAHRGIGAEDGLIRVEYQTERHVIEQPIIHEHHYHDPSPWYPSWPPRLSPYKGSTYSTLAASSRSMGATASAGQNVQCTQQATQCSSDAVITVAGSVSHQRFYATQDFPVEATDVLVLRLRGELGNMPVSAPVTVNTKFTCSSCGKVSGSDMQLCPRCGTALQVV